MLPAFNLGIAGRLGDGGHRMPWIVLDDVIDIIHRSLRDERYEGAINGVAPEIVTNSEFTSALAGVLRRPAIFPAPAFALRLALGRQMAEEILLADLAIEPARLRDLGYPFRYPKIEGALAYLLGKETTPIE
jgi:NAD dependent epimerase/dehydratase family enzyme